MDLQLSGLRALVTGGTRGIGRAIVEEFLAEGASVAFCARTRRGQGDAGRAVGGRCARCWAPRSTSPMPTRSPTG